MGLRMKRHVLTTAALFAGLSAMIGMDIFRELLTGGSILQNGLRGAVCVTGVAVCLDIWRLNPADSHSLVTLLQQYWYLLRLRMMAPHLRAYIKKNTMDPKKVSQATLLDILRTNQNSCYGKKYNFKEILSREDFVSKLPITTQLNSYVDRIKNGEPNVLSSLETSVLVTTSGTTGTPKYYSITSEFLKSCRFLFGDLIYATMLHLMNLQRCSNFHIFSPLMSRRGELPTSSSLLQLITYFPSYSILPEECTKLYTEDQSFYIQAIYCLAERELGSLVGFSADMMYSWVRFISENVDHICQDISRGDIGTHISMPENIRHHLSENMIADPERAAELKLIIQNGPIGLFKRIWPSMEYILMGKSAGFSISASVLIENQLKGLKIIDYTHGASEGIAGMNFESERSHVDNTFTLILFGRCFFEFIPIGCVDEKDPPTVFPEQVKVGGLYEIVVTNINGLYRYRYGDIIEVVGFTNGTPKYKFLYKLGQRLNIAGERTPDKFLSESIHSVIQSMVPDTMLANYTATESMVLDQVTGTMSKGRYIFFLELSDDKLCDKNLIAHQIDHELCTVYAPYNYDRDLGHIGHPDVIQVKLGTFEGLKTFLKDGKPTSQFKMPRVQRSIPALKYLLQHELN